MSLDDFKKYWGGEEFNKKKKSHPKLSYAYDACMLEYIRHVTKSVRNLELSKDAYEDIKSNMDLLDALYEYRNEKSADRYLELNPNYKEQEKHLRLLWDQFKELESENLLYDITYKCFKEIDFMRGII